MDDGHRRLLNRHRPELVRDIANVEPLFDLLISRGVFTATDDDIQNIRAQETPLERARRLLDVLQSRGPDAYEHFLDALRSVRPHLVRVLEQSEGSKDKAASLQSADSISLQASAPNGRQTVRKLQRALRTHYRELARSTTLLDHQTLAEPVGLDEVFVTLSALKFDEIRSLFTKQKKLTPKQIQDLATKTWSERRSGEEIIDLSRILKLENGRSAESCLLLGHAASGKTLTLYKLLSCWADGSQDFLKNFEFVFYVSGRDERALQGKSAVDVLQLDQFAGMKKAEENLFAEYIEENSDKVLILFDSVDEGGKKWASNEGIQQILRRKALGGCSFVVTSRPCLKAYELIPRCVQHFHLAGLNDYHLEELLKRRLGDEEGQALSDELKKAEWTKLRALMKETPLLANMVAVLVKDGLSLPKTRTEVYTVMLLNLVSRSQAKTESAVPISAGLENLPKEVKDSLREVSKVALAGLKRGQFVFDAKKDVTALSVDVAQRLGLVGEFRTVSVLGDKHEIHFSHLTWQEYLAAYCVSLAKDLDIAKELSLCQEKIGTGEETLPFWRFVAGLLDVKKLKVLMRELCRQVQHLHRTWRWLLFEMSCLAEAVQQPISCPEEEETKRSEIQEAAAVSLPGEVDFSNCVLSKSEVHSVSVALSCATHVTDVVLVSGNLGLVHLQILTATGALQHVQFLNCSGNSLNGGCLIELRRALMPNHRLKVLQLIRCDLDERDCDVLCQILSSHKSLWEVNLHDNPLGTNGHKILWTAVHASQIHELYLGRTVPVQSTASTPVSTPSYESILFGQHMQIIHMMSNDLRTEDAEPLLKAAQPPNAPCLSLLDLSHNRIDNRIVNVLATVFKHRSHQSSLAQPSHHSPVAFNRIRKVLGTAFQRIAHQLAMAHPSHPSPVALTIRLHDNEVDREGLEWLAKEVPVGSDDRVECGMLVVSGGKINQRDLSVHFDEYVQRGSKGDLDLRRAGIDASGTKQVAGQLYNDRVRVEALNLGRNSIGDEGASNLANALSRNSTLRALSIDGIKVGAIGFAALCKALAENNCTLQFLNIGYNAIFVKREENIAADACQQLARLLTSCRGLKGINLYDTGLGDEECCAMTDALVHSSTIVSLLDLADNQISDIGAHALCRGLEKNTSVRFLDLSGNPLSSDGLSAVFRCVEARGRSSHPLERVWIGDVNVDVSHFGGTVIRSRFECRSLSYVLDTFWAS